RAGIAGERALALPPLVEGGLDVSGRENLIERHQTVMPRELAQSKRASRSPDQIVAREITRSISARTNRSTNGGRLLSSHSFSIGRSSSRTRSAIVGPPLCPAVLRSDVSARTRLVTEPAAAVAVSGEARPPAADMDALMGELSDCGVVSVGAMGVGLVS